jgi:hypothetical protein
MIRAKAAPKHNASRSVPPGWILERLQQAAVPATA